MPAVRATEGRVCPATHPVCTSGQPAAQSVAGRLIGLPLQGLQQEVPSVLERTVPSAMPTPRSRRRPLRTCALARPQGAPQEVISTSERTALAHLGAWLADLGVAPAAGGSSDEEELADDAKARSYVHAIRDQYARHSLAPARPRRALWRDFLVWESSVTSDLA